MTKAILNIGGCYFLLPSNTKIDNIKEIIEATHIESTYNSNGRYYYSQSKCRLELTLVNDKEILCTYKNDSIPEHMKPFIEEIIAAIQDNRHPPVNFQKDKIYIIKNEIIEHEYPDLKNPETDIKEWQNTVIQDILN